MKVCQICSQKHYAKGFCRKHYRTKSGEYRRRWEVVRNDPDKLKKYINAQQKWYDKVKHEDWYKKNNAERSKRYYCHSENRREYLKGWKLRQSVDKKRKWYKRDRDTQHFAGLREFVIKRDGFKCQKCNMTREEHYFKYNADLAVHHIDHRGRTVPKVSKNNVVDNLQTLCFSCHRKADAKQWITI